MAKAERVAGTAPGGREVRIEFEGERISAREGEPLAAALLASGVEVFSRAVKYHRARGPYCLSGRCSQCLVRVDGEPNVTACTTPVRDGMRVERQNAFPSVNHDIFQTIDWMYPRGLDHHKMFAGVPVVEHVVAKVAREMAGLGTLPEGAKAPGASFAAHDTGVLVVGAGAAGLAAARAAAAAGATVTLVDEQPAPGGRLRSGLAFADAPAADWVDEQAEALREAGVHAVQGFAFGLYNENGTLVPVRTRGKRLLLVKPRAVVIAAGAAEPLPPFGNNDLPGVYAGRALARMITVNGVLPGKSAVVAGDGPEAAALAAVLRKAGCEVIAEVGLGKGSRGHLVRARGRASVAGAVIADATGKERKVRCDLIAIADYTSALIDLARHAGAHVAFRDGHFGVTVDVNGDTGVPGVFACGEVTGPCSVNDAAQQGERAGRAAAAFAAGGVR